jgi:cysteine-rich repeat protein
MTILITDSNYWDDGNSIDGDGWSSTWAVESGWSCSGGDLLNPDIWIDIWGDGIVMAQATTYCDDGNSVIGDGWDSSWNIEVGWECTLGDHTTASVCTEIWGDGIVIINTPTNWDDNNLVNGDGCSDQCIVEEGWECTGGSPTNPDYCHVVWGDGIYLSQWEECDDGDLDSRDGCSATWLLEPGFICNHDSSRVNDTEWEEIWGDGLRIIFNECDDGNNISGDGCSSNCELEPGYTWSGGSNNSPDMCEIVCGDGQTVDYNPTICDDGNTVIGDGCDSNCNVEPGWECTKPNDFAAHTCSEIWGDGKLIYLAWDDGNTVSGDGWSSTWTIEPGFVWSGGTSTHRSKWTEIWGDGANYGGNEWDDGNLVGNDGWSSFWEYEKCWSWVGGTSSSSDAWFYHEFQAEIGSMTEDTTEVDINFSSPMYLIPITSADIQVNILAEYRVKYSWTASYINSKTMRINMDIKTAMSGKETLIVKFINYKTIRGANGGCPIPESLSTPIPSSLSAERQLAKSMSKYTKYLIIGGVLSMFGIVSICAESFELIWSLINTLQLISYLPLMINYYPDHVEIMFEILSFANMDIEVLSDWLK